MDQSKFKIVKTSQDHFSIQNLELGEIMHNPLGPWREVHELYLYPSQLKERLLSCNLSQELVLYDVGLGAGANAMGALLTAFEAMQSSKTTASFQIISFEKELRLAEFALKERNFFPEFSWAWEAFEKLFRDRVWKHPEQHLTWKLHVGDFTQTIQASHPTADIIFYDPYSPKRNEEMWSYKTFSKLRNKCHANTRETLLLTYSRATSVRAALLLAGFYVGVGKSIGLKEETTLASTLPDLIPLLDQRWLERWKRSQNPYPCDLLLEGEKEVWSQKIESHPQFSKK